MVNDLRYPSSATITPPEVLSQKIAEAINSVNNTEFKVRAGLGENTAANHVGLVGVTSFDTGSVVVSKADHAADFMNMEENL